MSKQNAKIKSQEEKRKKIFIGGLGDDTTEEDVREYFGKFGEIYKSYLIYDKKTFVSRCFGFVEFSKFEPAGLVLGIKSHVIKGKVIECKSVMYKNELDITDSEKDCEKNLSKDITDSKKSTEKSVDGNQDSVTEDPLKKGSVNDKKKCRLGNNKKNNKKKTGGLTLNKEEIVAQIAQPMEFVSYVSQEQAPIQQNKTYGQALEKNEYQQKFLSQNQKEMNYGYDNTSANLHPQNYYQSVDNNLYWGQENCHQYYLYQQFQDSPYNQNYMAHNNYYVQQEQPEIFSKFDQ